MNQTTPNEDWLDALLQPRPVGDDGFTARVGRFASMQRRSAVFRRLLAAVVFVLVVPGGCTAFGLYGAGTVTHLDVDAILDGTPSWLDVNRAAFREAWLRYDGLPALARRTGRDAGTKLDGISCSDKEVCDTSALVGLAEFDQLTEPADLDRYALIELADQHLRQGLAKPVTPGEPDPFVAAATDVEALARQWFSSSSDALYVYRRLATRTDEAHALGRGIGFEPALSVRDVDIISRLQYLAWDYASIAGTADDHAFLRASKSTIVCTADGSGPWYERYRGYLDDDVVDRASHFTIEGCGPVTAVVPELCNDEAPAICTIGLFVARLPPWRQLIAEGARRGLPRSAEMAFIEAQLR